MMRTEGEDALMNNFIFENSTKTYFGRGCVKEYLACLARQYGKKVMLAYGGDSVRENGIYCQIIESLARAEKDVTEFADISENPTYEEVLEGARLVRENKVDFILAVGGGNVTDCCKAVSMGAVYDGDLWNDYFARQGIMEFEPVPLGVVVAGTGNGSEMNGRAVITNKSRRVRTGCDYPKCNPRFALVDPAYSCNGSRKQMATDGFATLSRIMETYLSAPHEDNVSDDIAEALMRNVIRNLRAAIRNPEDYTARSNLLWDAAMAENRIIRLGKCPDFQCRRMDDQLGAYTDCNRGAGLAALHPAYCRHIYRNGLLKFKRFAENVWGISGKGKTDEEIARAGIHALEDFIAEIGLPKTLRELGVDGNTDLRAIADSCAAISSCGRKLTQEELLEILRECY